MTETLRTETIDGESWTEHASRLYCRECQRMTHPAAETLPTEPGDRDSARCWVCGDDYQCDTCGAAMAFDHMGNAECEDDPEH